MKNQPIEFSQFIVRDAKYLPCGFNELSKILSDAKKEKRKLRIKLGIDPTSTDLHFGHTVCLHYLRKFQEIGHIPVLIIGGFTATVGDPSGTNATRPVLTYKEVQENAKTYLTQVSKILDITKLEVVNNYDWLNSISLAKLIELAHTVTVNQLIAKEAFGNRIEQGEPLYLHEVLYPILQGYDSVHVKADIEIGGVDQTFNVLFGRHVQKYFNQKEQFVILLPLLVGLDGKKKMSKSFNNYIALNDPPEEIFGKVMSISDDLIKQYFLVSSFQANELYEMEQSLEDKNNNPRDIKVKLAHNFVAQLYGLDLANKAKERFTRQFQKGELPEDISNFALAKPMHITELMCEAKLVQSKTEAKKLIAGGGVKLKSIKVLDPNLLITEKDKDSVLQIGKRKFIKII